MVATIKADRSATFPIVDMNDTHEASRLVCDPDNIPSSFL
jgi:hypothetical protein